MGPPIVVASYFKGSDRIDLGTSANRFASVDIRTRIDPYTRAAYVHVEQTYGIAGHKSPALLNVPDPNTGLQDANSLA